MVWTTEADLTLHRYLSVCCFLLTSGFEECCCAVQCISTYHDASRGKYILSWCNSLMVQTYELCVKNQVSNTSIPQLQVTCTLYILTSSSLPLEISKCPTPPCPLNSKITNSSSPPECPIPLDFQFDNLKPLGSLCFLYPPRKFCSQLLVKARSNSVC